MRVHCELALEKKTHSLVCSTWAKISFFSLKLASHKTTPHQPHQPQNKLSSLLWTQSQETKPLKTDKSPRKHYFLKENKLHTTLGSDNSVPWRIWVPWRQQERGGEAQTQNFVINYSSFYNKLSGLGRCDRWGTAAAKKSSVWQHQPLTNINAGAENTFIARPQCSWQLIFLTNDRMHGLGSSQNKGVNFSDCLNHGFIKKDRLKRHSGLNLQYILH